MRNLLGLFFLLGLMCGFPHQAHAVNCNPSTFPAGCPTQCPATKGSLTAAAIPNTGWTQGGTTIASVDCLYGIQYQNAVVCPHDTNDNVGPGNQCLLDYFYPHGADPTKIYVIVCYHGGGWNVGDRQSCFGAPNGPFDITMAVNFVQKYADTPNPVGGKGIAIAMVDYRLTASGNGNPGSPFPAQWQDAKCAVMYLLANGFNSTFPGNSSIIGMYGPSAGGTVAWWAGSTPDNLYTTSCPSPTAAPSGGYRVVNAWPATQFMSPTNLSNWECTNTQATIFTAFEDIMNCTTQANCRTAATSLNIDPTLNTSQGNIAALQRSTNLLQFGAADQLILPYFSASNNCTSSGGNLVSMVNAYSALSPPIHPQVEVLPNCAHECDLAQINGGSLIDAFNFLMNVSGSSSSGAISSGILPGG